MNPKEIADKMRTRIGGPENGVYEVLPPVQDVIINRKDGTIGYIPREVVQEHQRATIQRHIPEHPLYIVEDARVKNEIYRIASQDVYVFPVGSTKAQEEFAQEATWKRGRIVSYTISRQMRRAIDRALEKKYGKAQK